MAQEIQNEVKTSRCDSGFQSSKHHLFGSEEKGEEDVDAEVDLEVELLCALEELNKIRKEY